MPFGVQPSLGESLVGILRLGLVLVLFLAVPVGVVSLIVGICVRRSRVIVAAIVTLLAVGFPVFHLLSDLHPIRTGVSVASAEVTFLKLPSTASDVSYWENGYFWMADFTLPEEDFLAVFPKFQFIPITDSERVELLVYGDPNQPPYRQFDRPVRKVTSGLIYETRQGNGGGFRIVYDRDASKGYFRFVAR